MATPPHTKSSGTDVGVPAWVWVLAALLSLEGLAGVGATGVLREGLELSRNRSTVDLRHVRKTLTELEREGAVTSEAEDGVTLFSITREGRARLATFVELLDRVRRLVENEARAT